MQLKFKQQQYQADAARAVVEVFAGQPKQGQSAYLRDVGRAPAADPSHGLGRLTLDDAPAEGFGNAPVVLSAEQLLENVRRVQRGNQVQESAALCCELGACQLDVEMETGTGKTYVYTKTMLELHAAYGWTKFIVVVPSVAIREGVFASMRATEQHFFELYGCGVHPFVYDSKRLSELDAFAASADVCCMIINMQAFNASMKEDGTSKEARIIFSERDDFGSRRPIDVIAATNPIVVLDEPQKMGGANGATHKGIARFRPLFTLGYSATHKEKHNLVYVLDALDAYNQRLVKRIEVKGFTLKHMRGTDGYLFLKDIVVSARAAPVAVIEFKKMGANGTVRKVTRRFREGDDLYEASGPTRLEAYRGYVIARGNDGIVPGTDGRPGHVRFLNGEELFVGQVAHDSAQETMQRVQIRETIASHLQKEEALFRRGVKCLSLFFIDEVAKYRTAHGGADGVYARVFEEEYAAAVEERLARPSMGDALDRAYIGYLRRDAPAAVHSGYFSIDKKGNAVESRREKKAERQAGIGINDDDARRAYDLILRDKERLLSFDEPVRFVFSHSALREGWDNPNIFQICTLKESASEVSKRQEVGRGMRLAVDAEGNRQDAELLGADEVQRVNVLTVVASESYESFVAELQSDIARTLRERPKSVGTDFFEDVTVQVEGREVTFTAKESKRIYKFLVKHDYLDDDDRPSEAFRTAVEDGSFVEAFVVEFAELFGDDDRPARAACALLQSVYDPHALDGLVGPAREKQKNPLNANFRRAEFQELWDRINRMHAYTVDFDDEELREKAIARIDADLKVSRVQYTLTTGAQAARARREDVQAGASFSVGSTATRDVHASAAPAVEVAYDLVGEVAGAAQITRRSAAAILGGLDANVYALFCVNPEEFIKKCADLIKSEKGAMVVDHITYHEIEGCYDSAIFTERMPEDAARAYRAKKNVQDYVFPDGQTERAFAAALDAASEVAVYAKLPRGFQIPTPVGGYAPDWAIAFKEGAVRHLFFVAETKGTLDSMQLRGVEACKIECAKKLFAQMSHRGVRYHHVATYDDLLTAIGREG